jgi:hypothetical protein
VVNEHELISKVDAAFAATGRGMARWPDPRLWSGDREITFIGRDRSQGSGSFKRGEVHAIVIDPTGWLELSGAAWTADA